MKLSDYVHNGILPISYESALQDVRNRVVCDYVSEEDAILLLDNMVKLPYYTHIDSTSEEIYE